MNNELIVGDKVTLSHCTTWSTTDPTNPLNTEGVVVEIDEFWVYVLWGDPVNIRNAYSTEDADLILSGKENTKDTTKYYKISEERLKSLLNAEAELIALEAAGVDNWSGYGDVDWTDEIETVTEFEEI